MRHAASLRAAIYTAFLVIANAAPATALDDALRTEAEALRDGDMRKLVLHERPRSVPEIAFTDTDGNEQALSESNGAIRLVNFWATWCAPCRLEKPALDTLQQELGGTDFEVIAIATGRNSPEGIARFNEEVGVTHLTTYLDPRSDLAAAMNVPGLPVTVLLDRNGKEIGRLLGGAEWTSESARAILALLLERS